MIAKVYGGRGAGSIRPATDPPNDPRKRTRKGLCGNRFEAGNLDGTKSEWVERHAVGKYLQDAVFVIQSKVAGTRNLPGLNEVRRRRTAQTRPFETNIRIAGIVDPRNPVVAQIDTELVPGLPKERPKQATPRPLNDGRHAGEAVESAPPFRTHRDCFNLIVDMVTGKQMEDAVSRAPIRK